MVRHTSTIVAVPSPADTQLSPMGVAWSTNALVACSLRMGSQDSPRSHCPIVLCCPENGREAPMPNCSRTDSGLRRGATSARDPLSYIFISRFLEPSLSKAKSSTKKDLCQRFCEPSTNFCMAMRGGIAATAGKIPTRTHLSWVC
jgi:hypothetical protein